MVPAIIQNESFEAGGTRPKKILAPPLVKSLAARLQTDTAEDFRRWKPSVVIVQQCHANKYTCLGLSGINFDPLSWFLQSSEFANEWKHYSYQSSRGDYVVYVRTR
jgi:hypothetical protein